MRNRRSGWTLLILILAGALVGGLLGELLASNSGFEWISLGGANGYRQLIAVSLNPLVDSHVIRLGFSFALGVNAGSILGIIMGVIIYFKT